MPVLRFQVLWHLVTVEIVAATGGVPAGIPVTHLGKARWPIQPEVQSGYRVEQRKGGWQVRQEADVLGAADDFESAWEMLRARIKARCFELAGRKGWAGFTGTLVSSAQDRMCLIGPLPQRERAADILGRSGWVLESHDGWVSRGGNVLAAPLPGSPVAAQLRTGPIDRLLVFRPDADGPALTGPQALMALVGCADRTCQSPGEVLRSATDLLNRARTSRAWTPEILGPPWYVCDLLS